MAEIEMDMYNNQMGMMPMGTPEMAMQPMMMAPMPMEPMMQPMMPQPMMPQPMMQQPMAAQEEEEEEPTPTQPVVETRVQPTKNETKQPLIQVPLQVHGSQQMVHHVPVSDNNRITYGPKSQVVQCCHCKNIVYTYTLPSCCSCFCYSYLAFLFLIFTGCMTTLCLLTCCSKERMVTTVHICPICYEKLGKSERRCRDHVD